MRRNVVLPEPLGPSRQNTSPRRTCRSSRSTAMKERYRLLTPSATMAMSSGAAATACGAFIRPPHPLALCGGRIDQRPRRPAETADRAVSTRSVVELGCVLGRLEQLRVVRDEELRVLG